MEKTPATEAKPGMSRVKLAIGAASLFLFIVGLKRSFSMDDAPGGGRVASDPEEEGRERGKRRGGGRG